MDEGTSPSHLDNAPARPTG